jgi:hypothetical protein
VLGLGERRKGRLFVVYLSILEDVVVDCGKKRIKDNLHKMPLDLLSSERVLLSWTVGLGYLDLEDSHYSVIGMRGFLEMSVYRDDVPNKYLGNTE